MHYFYHPESGSLWAEEKSLSQINTDGLVEELDYTEYLQQLGKITMSLPDTVDFRSIQPKQGGGDKHPPGIHDFVITNTYLQENKEGTGAMLVVEFTSPVGMMLNRYNVANPNPDTVRISNEQLSALGHAINIYQLAYPKNADGSPNMQMAGHTLRGGRGKMEIVPQMVKGADGKMVENGFMKINKIFDSNGNDPCKPNAAPQTQQSNGNGSWSAGPTAAPAATPAPQSGGWASNAQQPSAPQQQPAPNAAPTGKPSWA